MKDIIVDIEISGCKKKLSRIATYVSPAFSRFVRMSLPEEE
jgi:hypothetical protein